MTESQAMSSERFNFPDSDLTIESSDGVRFRVHRKNLWANSQAFPGPEFESNDEITNLSEPSDILEILFQFMYPIRQPRLENLSLFTVIAVAEAVQKYQVFSAMFVCEHRLKELILEDSQAVLAHVLRHYEEYDTALINQAARASSRKPLSSFIEHSTRENVAQRLVHTWIKYTEKWDELFAQVGGLITDLRPTTNCVNKTDGTRYACNHCTARLLAWVQNLQQKTEISDVEEGIRSFKYPFLLGNHQSCCTACNAANYCIHGNYLTTHCREKIDAIPSYTDLISTTSPNTVN